MRTQNYRGSALAMVLLILAIMLLMVVGLNQVVVMQQKTNFNLADKQLAQNYAYAALLDAEVQVLTFDTNAALESPVMGGAGSGYESTDSYASRRYNGVLNKGGGIYNIVANGVTCNLSGVYQGWCYQWLSGDPNFSSNQAWQPWLESSANVVKPCNSYVSETQLPLIDEKSTFVNAHVYASGNSSLCDQPRYYIEPINLSFTGYKGASAKGYITQTNLSSGIDLVMYDNTAASDPSYGLLPICSLGAACISNSAVATARLYRITVRAFGYSGNTRVLLQEYIAIAQYAGNNVRTAGDTATNKTYRIIPIALRWIY